MTGMEKIVAAADQQQRKQQPHKIVIAVWSSHNLHPHNMRVFHVLRLMLQPKEA